MGLRSTDNSSFDGQLLGFTVRSFDNNIAVSDISPITQKRREETQRETY